MSADFQPEEWMGRSKCRTQLTIPVADSLFFPPDPNNHWPAKQFCKGKTAGYVGVCPVLNECLEFAVRTEGDVLGHGVWGGMSPRERRALTKRASGDDAA